MCGGERVRACIWVCVLKTASNPRPAESAHQGERLLTPVVKCSLPALTIGHWLDEGFSFTLADSISASGLHTFLKVIHSPFHTTCAVEWSPPIGEPQWLQQLEQLLDLKALIYRPCRAVHIYRCWGLGMVRRGLHITVMQRWPLCRATASWCLRALLCCVYKKW